MDRPENGVLTINGKNEGIFIRKEQCKPLEFNIRFLLASAAAANISFDIRREVEWLADLLRTSYRGTSSPIPTPNSEEVFVEPDVGEPPYEELALSSE